MSFLTILFVQYTKEYHIILQGKFFSWFRLGRGGVSEHKEKLIIYNKMNISPSPKVFYWPLLIIINWGHHIQNNLLKERVNFILWLSGVIFAPFSCKRVTPGNWEFCTPRIVISQLKLLARSSTGKHIKLCKNRFA